MLRALALLVGIVVVAGLWVVNCTGPRPAVTDVHVEAPAAADEPYLLTAVVRNQGWGHGQIQVTMRLRDKATGQVYHEEQQATLEAGETARVVGEFRAPPGDYEPLVEAEYPPR